MGKSREELTSAAHKQGETRIIKNLSGCRNMYKTEVQAHRRSTARTSAKASDHVLVFHSCHRRLSHSIHTDSLLFWMHFYLLPETDKSKTRILVMVEEAQEQLQTNWLYAWDWTPARCWQFNQYTPSQSTLEVVLLGTSNENSSRQHNNITEW